ncbi:hypothetical protein ACFC18_20370 [Streptomyces sp. NPDC056121]|uniref:hypothetical protein n=1 Tax=Streptomyces TaxID=1883 RepID=UPI001D0A1BF2|nr:MULTISPECIES: hypothetical protein [Streptomyces]MCX5082945.1 hypothetical protein [Streptomyces sp. NBC_00401]UDM01067.1 hypothetical protein LGI35_23735 [Streptomyces longhuiensis]
MAHAAPASGTSGLRSMAAGSRLSMALPLLLGIVYGIWASGIRRDAGPTIAGITTGNVLFGFLTGIIVAVVTFGIHRASFRLPRELRAVTWAAWAGIAFGYLYSLTDASVLRSTIMALVVAAGVFAAMFYHYYTHE